MSFFFSTPIGRLMFLARSIVAVVIMGGVGVLMQLSETAVQDNATLELVVVVLWVVFLWLPLLYYFMRFIIIARLRSIGLSGWFALIFLVPAFNFLFSLFLLFCPADTFNGHTAE